MMVCLPVMLCSEGFMGFNYLLLDLETRISSEIFDLEKTSEEERKRYLEEEKRIWKTKYKPKGKQLVDDAIHKAEGKFNSMLKRPEIYKSYRSLLYSAIVFVWCNFEVFMKDLWEASLNTAGKRVKKTALGNINKIENNDGYSGIRGKYVNLDYLGQYDFNISNKLGSILVNKLISLHHMESKMHFDVYYLRAQQ